MGCNGVPEVRWVVEMAVVTKVLIPIVYESTASTISDFTSFEVASHGALS